MKIALFGKKFDDALMPFLEKLLSFFVRNNVEVLAIRPMYEFMRRRGMLDARLRIAPFVTILQETDADLLLSIGGDGTFLESATYARGNVPIMGVNSGRLGFLSEVSQDDIEAALQSFFDGRFVTSKLDVIALQSMDGEVIDFALNEFAVTKRDSSSMLTIHTYVNNEFLTTYWADGLIVSTPTGSTAYSMSVGGPIVHPATPVFILTPIAPHNLTVRPLVVSNDVDVRLHIESRGRRLLTSLDGRMHLCDTNTCLQIKKAPFNVRVVQLPEHSFYATLRNKLMWGADKRN